MRSKQKDTQSGLISSIRKAFSKSNKKPLGELSEEQLYTMQSSKGLSRKSHGPKNNVSSRNRHAKSSNIFAASELD